MKNILDNINIVRRRLKMWMNNRPWFQSFDINVNLHDMPRFDITRFAMWFGTHRLNFGTPILANLANGPNN